MVIELKFVPKRCCLKRWTRRPDDEIDEETVFASQRCHLITCNEKQGGFRDSRMNAEAHEISLFSCEVCVVDTKRPKRSCRVRLVSIVVRTL